MKNLNSKLIANKNPSINYKFKIDNSIDEKDIKAVIKVMKTGVLSGFVASNNKFFKGGREVKKFENLWSKYIGIKYSVGVTSCSAALHIALA